MKLMQSSSMEMQISLYDFTYADYQWRLVICNCKPNLIIQLNPIGKDKCTMYIDG